MNDKIIDVLVKARELISVEAQWTQGAIARDADGNGLLHACSELAVCWCSHGAVSKVTVSLCDNNISAIRALNKYCRARDESGNDPLVLLNDTVTHSEILRVWDGAIEMVKTENLYSKL